MGINMKPGGGWAVRPERVGRPKAPGKGAFVKVLENAKVTPGPRKLEGSGGPTVRNVSMARDAKAQEANLRVANTIPPEPIWYTPGEKEMSIPSGLDPSKQTGTGRAPMDIDSPPPAGPAPMDVDSPPPAPARESHTAASQTRRPSSRAAESQTTPRPRRAAASSASQTEPRASRSAESQTTPRPRQAAASSASQTEPRASRSAESQTAPRPRRAAASSASQTEPRAAASSASQTEPRANRAAESQTTPRPASHAAESQTPRPRKAAAAASSQTAPPAHPSTPAPMAPLRTRKGKEKMVVEPTTPAVSTSGAGPSGYRRASPSQSSSSAMDEAEDAAIQRQAELVYQEHVERQRMRAAEEVARAARAEEDREAQRRAEEEAEAAAAAAAATHRRLEANTQALRKVEESRKEQWRAEEGIRLMAGGHEAETTDRARSRYMSRERAQREVKRDAHERSAEAMEWNRQAHIEGRERRAAEFRAFVRQHGAGPAEPMDTSPGREAKLMKAMYRNVSDASIEDAINQGYKINQGGIFVDKNNHFATPPWTNSDTVPERIERAPVRNDRPPPEPRAPSTRTRRPPAWHADYVMK